MKLALIDTDILSRFFRRVPRVVERFGAYAATYGQIAFSIVSYDEILSGLPHRDLGYDDRHVRSGICNPGY